MEETDVCHCSHHIPLNPYIINNDFRSMQSHQPTTFNQGLQDKGLQILSFVSNLFSCKT